MKSSIYKFDSSNFVYYGCNGQLYSCVSINISYTARLVISDPNSVYSNDTVSVTMNAGDTKTLAAITLARSSNITTTISGTVVITVNCCPI